MKIDYEHPELAEVDFGKFARGNSAMAPGPVSDNETEGLGMDIP